MKKHENYFLLNVISYMGKKKKSGGIKEAVLTVALRVALGAAVGTVVERVISCILDYFFK